MPEVKSLNTPVVRDPRLLVLEGAAIRLRDRIVVRDLNWELRKGEHWVISGPNGAGKSSFARALAGELAIVRGRIKRMAKASEASRVGYISFESQQHLLLRELRNETTREFSGKLEDYNRGADLLPLLGKPVPGHNPEITDLLASLDLQRLAAQGIHQLSTGELRKILIVRCLQSHPGVLILDEPFDGLDPSARQIIRQLLIAVMERDIPTLLITHRRDELLPGITHALVLEAGRVHFQGPLKNLETLPGEPSSATLRKPPIGEKPLPRRIEGTASPLRKSIRTAPIIRMTDVTVGYGPTVVLGNLDWSVRPGQHWAVTGANGAGKSTLMALITADHPQAYANRIELFGRRRGSGESIWEIKQRIGMVSFEQQVRYYKTITASEVVLSGFFDSIGLFRRASPRQHQQAEAWILRLNLKHLAPRPFTQLSHGERRLVLLARAMVKQPEVLILDEPCQGLDPANRERVLALVDQIAAAGSQLIFVTHYPGELPRCITHHLHLPDPGTAESVEIKAVGNPFDSRPRPR